MMRKKSIQTRYAYCNIIQHVEVAFYSINDARFYNIYIIHIYIVSIHAIDNQFVTYTITD